MERKIVQDIRPAPRRIVKRAPPRRLEVEEDELIERVPLRRIHDQSEPVLRMPDPKPKTGQPRKFSGLIVTFCVIFLCVGVIAVALSLFFSKASVTITPKKANFNISETTFTAKKDMAAAATSSAGSITSGLMYQVVVASESLSQTVEAVDGPMTETKAKGAVTLYNEQKSAQKIVAGSRLSNPDGQIYRTSSTVTIPAGKAGNPGTIAVNVIADRAGAEYNMTLDSGTAFSSAIFRFAGYKGTPKYATVYGKMKTGLSGGFSGSKKIISAEVKQETVKLLKENVKNKLLEKVKPLTPLGYVMYDDAHAIDYVTPEPVSSDRGSAIITVDGTISGVIFNKDTLLKSIAKRELDKIASPTYTVEGLEDLDFTIMNAKDFSPKKGTPLIFTLKGPLTIVSTLSETALKNELKGTYLKDSNAVFAHYPAIGSAYALITPFWMRSFPNDPQKIMIEIKD